jgi:hypothetical protein
MKNTTKCPKIGIKIHETITPHLETKFPNEQKSTKKSSIDFYNTSLNSLDLNLDNYNLDDICNLFNIRDLILSETSLKEAKQIVYKMHPDKSKLDPKYFLFFSQAYKRLYSVYQFQNKSTKKSASTEEYYNDSDKILLEKMFENNADLKDSKNFNEWFNAQFDKYKIKEEDSGYGEWLKSNEGIISSNGENITQNNMNEIIEKQKKQLQEIVVYSGVEDNYSLHGSSGSLLNNTSNNFGENALFSQGNLSFTDLKQAHIETIIPVTQEDYQKIPKYNTIQEYQTAREHANTTPIDKIEAEKMLYYKQKQAEQESMALAFKYAKEAEVVMERQSGFWSSIKQIMGR